MAKARILGIVQDGLLRRLTPFRDPGVGCRLTRDPPARGRPSRARSTWSATRGTPSWSKVNPRTYGVHSANVSRGSRAYRDRARAVCAGSARVPRRPETTYRAVIGANRRRVRMTDVVIVAAGRTAVGSFNGAVAKIAGGRSWGARDSSLAGAKRDQARAGLGGAAGAGVDGGRGAEPGAPGADQGGAAGDDPGDDDQQGVRLGAEGDASGRAGDKERRCGDCDGGRAGEHESGPAPACRARATASGWGMRRLSTR